MRIFRETDREYREAALVWRERAMFRRPGSGVNRRTGFRGIGGGGAVQWTPLDLASLQRWWQPGVNMVGDPITDWTDVKSAALLEDGGTTTEPAVGTIGGFACPHFDGSNDHLIHATSNALYKYLHDGTGCTVACVVSHDGTATARAFFNTGDDDAGETGLYLGADGAGPVNFSVGNSSATFVAEIVSTGTPFASTGPVVVVATFESAAGAILHINGTEDGTASTTGTPATGNSTNALRVGSRTGGRFWDGEVGDVLVFNAALTGADLANLHDYLLGKYL